MRFVRRITLLRALLERVDKLPPTQRLLVGWLIVLPIACLIPLFLSPTGHQQDILGVLVEGEIYAMLALGLNVVVGFAGLLDLGYAAFFAIGAYGFGFIGSSHFQPTGSFSLGPIISWDPTGIHANFWLFLPIMAAITALFGVLLGAPTLRLRGDYLAIVTLGFGEIVQKIVSNLGPGATISAFNWPDITGGTNSFDGIFAPKFGPVQFDTGQVPWYYLGLAVLGVIITIAYSLQDSRLGRAWVALREDELAASCMGINLTRTKLLAFSMGAFFSGFAGVIEGSHAGLIDPSGFTFSFSISILVMVVLGGLGSVPGVVLGAVIIAAIKLYLLDRMNEWAHNLHLIPDSFSLTQAQYLIFGVILVLMMLFRREGLLPSGQRRRELHPNDPEMLREENQQLYTTRMEGN